MTLWLHSACCVALPAPSRALLSSFPAETAPVIAATLLPREGGEGCPPLQCTVSQRRRMPMDIAVAQQCLREAMADTVQCSCRLVVTTPRERRRVVGSRRARKATDEAL